jgi:hypothetical protein
MRRATDPGRSAKSAQAHELSHHTGLDLVRRASHRRAGIRNRRPQHALLHGALRCQRTSVASLLSQQAGSGHGVAVGLEDTFLRRGRVAGPLWAGISLDLHLTAFWTAAFGQGLAIGLAAGCRTSCPARGPSRPTAAGPDGPALTCAAGPRIMRSCEKVWCTRRTRSAAAPARDDLATRRQSPAPQSRRSGFPDHRGAAVVL